MDTPDGPRLERIHVGVYVDDLATVYLHDDEHSLYRSFISKLEARWNVEDEGELTDLLGKEVQLEIDRELIEDIRYLAYDLNTGGGFILGCQNGFDFVIGVCS